MSAPDDTQFEPKQHDHYVVVVVDIAEQRTVGVDFCTDLDDMNFKAETFRDDYGPGYLVLTHPSAEAVVLDAAKKLAMLIHADEKEKRHE